MKINSYAYAALCAHRDMLSERISTASLPETSTYFAHALDRVEALIADALYEADIAMREAEAEGRHR